MATWFRLQLMAATATRLYTKNEHLKKKTELIENFLLNSKRGSKKIRKILEENVNALNGIQNLRIIATFHELTQTINQSDMTVKRCLGAWKHSYYDNNIREFLFKFRNNQLGLNNRINAFDPAHDPRCNFCKIRDSNTTIRDSFVHVFYHCPTTLFLLTRLVGYLEPAPDVNSNMFYNLYWFGNYDENPNWEVTNLVVFDLFRYLIFKFKMRRKIPNSAQFFGELKFLLEITARKNQSIRVSLLSNNLIANLLPALG